MNRLTYFDKDSNSYALINPKADWLQTLGRLEDFKEQHEPETLGQYLADLRKSLGFTQEEFSQKAHIARSTLAKYESGQTKPKKEFLHSIIKHCNVPAEELQAAYRKYVCYFNDAEFNELFDSKPLNRLGYDIGRLVKCEREFSGLTKGKLAAKLGNVSTQTITKIESGEIILNSGFCKQLAFVLQSKRLDAIAEKLRQK